MEMQNEKELLIAAEKVQKKFEILQKNNSFLTVKRLKLRKGICYTCRKQAGLMP